MQKKILRPLQRILRWAQTRGRRTLFPSLRIHSLVDRLYDPQQVQPLPRLVRENLHHNEAAWRKLYVEHDVKELAEVVMQEEIEARLSDKKALFVEDTK
jgi:hypothetical protein